MTQDPYTNEQTISTLKESLLQQVENTNDSSVLTRCLEMLEAAQKRREEGDEIVKEMAVMGQLRNSMSDKQQLVSHSLASKVDKDRLQEESDTVDADEPAADDRKRKFSPYALLHDTVSNHRQVVGVLAAIAVCAVIVLASKYFHWGSNDDDKEVTTVATKIETIEVNGYRFNMVHVDGGTFTMGATVRDGEQDNDELPVQQVTLSSYSIGETEVTQGLWKAVMGNLPATFDGDNHPMKSISWDDCQEFIAQLNKLTGHKFRLPTEAQWEFAARGGNQSKNYKYAGSNNIDEVAWYSGNAWDMGKESPAFGNHAVGTRKPNELGLYDMSGNVWEWCQDCYEHYDGKPKKDPVGPLDSKNSYRVNRGGSWDYIAESARSCNRRNRTPDFRNFNLGMRLAE